MKEMNLRAREGITEETSEVLTKSKARRIVDKLTTALMILSIVFCIMIVFFIRPFEVSGHSMDITFHDGQRIFVSKMAYQNDLPERGDVIVFKEDGECMIKRVIALPGDTIRIDNCQTYVNNNPIGEPYVESWSPESMEERVVPEDFVFVMGDNRDNSYDSRDFGPVEIDSIIGKVL